MKREILLGMALLLAACTAFGPPSITLSRSEIAERAFAGSGNLELRKFFKDLEGLSITGPDVGFQTTAQRIELAWTAKLAEGPMRIPLSLSVSVSGKPILNAQGSGIDLAETHIEEVRLAGLPGLPRDTFRQDESLGTLPLLQFRPEELNRDGVVYRATAVSLGTFGLRVDLVAK